MKKANVDLQIRLKENLKLPSDNLLSPYGAKNKDLDTALQMLLARVIYPNEKEPNLRSCLRFSALRE